MGYGGDELVVGVGFSAGAKADVVIGDIAGVGSSCSNLCFSGSSRSSEGEAKSRDDGGKEGDHFEVFEGESSFFFWK